MATGRIAYRTARRDNPLRRRSDRIETRGTLLLLLLMLVSGPALAAWAADAAYRRDQAAAAWERTHRFSVDAELLEDAAPTAARPPAVVPPVRCRWIGPDGRERVGSLSVPIGSRAGSTVPVWVDETGRAADPPRRHSPVTEAVTAAVAVLLGVALAGWGARAAMVALLDRHRMRRWAQQWREVEPRWSRTRW